MSVSLRRARMSRGQSSWTRVSRLEAGHHSAGSSRPAESSTLPKEIARGQEQPTKFSFRHALFGRELVRNRALVVHIPVRVLRTLDLIVRILRNYDAVWMPIPRAVNAGYLEGSSQTVLGISGPRGRRGVAPGVVYAYQQQDCFVAILGRCQGFDRHCKHRGRLRRIQYRWQQIPTHQPHPLRDPEGLRPESDDSRRIRRRPMETRMRLF
jgi:hypothetical protein